ncbi:MAG: hypothetical protein K2O09_05770 [Treponemataceae bacterium]|nr:hypothetical protein [Treponemataceae bacterium]
MTGIKKYLFIMAALAAVFGFVACGNDEEEDNIVAVYTATMTEDGIAVTETMTFYGDNTFLVTDSAMSITVTEVVGTYTGDPSKDGRIIMTIEKINDDGILVDVMVPISMTVWSLGGKCTIYDVVYTRM